jgi:hypothetical protein
LPDVTIEGAASGVTYLWEHLGVLADPGYRRRWNAKLAWYEREGVRRREDGGGERATLIVTEDSAEGGIDSERIQSIIHEIWG